MVLGAQIGPLPYPCLPACREARKAPPASPAPGVSLIIWTFPITVNILGEFPLQHPKRTRFRLFRAFPGAFRSFGSLFTYKIFRIFFVRSADNPHRMKSLVIPPNRDVSFLT